MDGDGDESVVTAPGPGGSVGCGDERDCFGVGEEANELTVGSFSRDGEDSLDGLCVVGVTERGVFEQGVDGGEPVVSGPDTVVSNLFEMVEERCDQCGVDIDQVEV